MSRRLVKRHVKNFHDVPPQSYLVFGRDYTPLVSPKPHFNRVTVPASSVLFVALNFEYFAFSPSVLAMDIHFEDCFYQTTNPIGSSKPGLVRLRARVDRIEETVEGFWDIVNNGTGITVIADEKNNEYFNSNIDLVIQIDGSNTQ